MTERLKTGEDVEKIVKRIIENTNGLSARGDVFFENAERLLLESCVFYTLEMPQAGGAQGMAAVRELLREANDKKRLGVLVLDEKFGVLPKDSSAVKCYHSFLQASGRVTHDIILSCLKRIQASTNSR